MQKTAELLYTIQRKHNNEAALKADAPIVGTQPTSASSLIPEATTLPLEICDANRPVPFLATAIPLVDELPALLCDILVVQEGVGLSFRVLPTAHDEVVFAELPHPGPHSF